MQGILTDLRWLGTVTLLAVLLAVVTLIGGADHSFAATFNPTGEACLDNETTPAKCDGDSTPGAISGIATSFNLPKGDANFSAVISFTPPEWFVANGNDIPDGALVGKLTAGATLGLIGGACDGALTPTFPMMDATISPSSQVTFDDGFKDADSDGVADAVTKYPDFLARIFPGQTLRARLYGQAKVTSVDVSLNFLIFNPGDPIKDITPDPKLGYPSVTILQNIGDPDIQPASTAISDFCSPLTSNTITFGTSQDNPKTAANEGGKVYRKNPTTAGTYVFVAYAASLRDADGDGLENSLDTCPFNPDTWNPRAGSFGTPQPGDSDGDRIPDTCDPNPNDTHPSIDLDQDAYLNTGDNCPQVANGIDTAGTVLGPNNQKDSDEDGIGDECDILGAGGIGKGPNVDDGETLKLCGVNPMQVGGGGGTPDTKVLDRIPCGAGVADVTPTPTPPPDADGDGVPDSADKCAGTPAGTSVNADGCSAKQIEDLAKKVLGTLTSGLSLATGLANVTVGSSTVLAAGFADDAGKAVAGAAVTFKIDQQPGSDANLEGQAQVTKTTDAQGVATATLNVGSKPGAIVVSAAAQGKTKTVTVNVAAAAAGPGIGSGPISGIGTLAPVAASVPAWAAFVTAAGGIGLLVGIGTLASRRLTARRRRD